MLNNNANQPAKPPPLPASVADHARPAAANQPAPPSQWINLNLIVPDLPVAHWASRIFKFYAGLALATLALCLPILAIAAIVAAIGAAVR